MLADLFRKAELHAERAQSAYEEIRSWPQLDAAACCDTNKTKTIDSFLYRFSKLQDLLGSKIFCAYLDRLGEYEDSMSLLDVLDRLEKLQIIASADQWMGYRRLRNQLAHEYPDNQEEMLAGIRLALEAFCASTALLRRLQAKAR